MYSQQYQPQQLYNTIVKINEEMEKEKLIYQHAEKGIAEAKQKNDQEAVKAKEQQRYVAHQKLAQYNTMMIQYKSAY